MLMEQVEEAVLQRAVKETLKINCVIAEETFKGTNFFQRRVKGVNMLEEVTLRFINPKVGRLSFYF